ncbi:LOW QUALITY PROTEIN: tudor and KH domain-containing protein [Pelodytes ibericus]
MNMTSWNLTSKQKIAVTIGVSAGAAILYVCYSKYRNGRVPSYAGEDAELCMKIPLDAVELLVRSANALSLKLQKVSDAHIKVSRDPDSKGECEVVITGSPSQVCQAREAVQEILQENAVLRVQLLLSARCMCRIIGKGTDKIRSISKSSGAKIQCEQKPEGADVLQTRCITVTGTKKQVEAAKLLIQKMTEDEDNLQQRAAKSSAFRCRRKDIIAVKKKDGAKPLEDQMASQKNQTSAEISAAMEAGGDQPQGECPSSQESITDAYNMSRFEVPSPDFTFQADEYVDIYVSAVENPQHFWIQILGPRSSHLDKLTTEMSEHYQKQQGSAAEIQVGDIVAAPFRTDKSWYRAEVVDFNDNGNVDLYYVDYGDSWVTSKEILFPLRSDFLSLPFQAIECSLTGIAPVDGEWTNLALDMFDDLTHCAQWKPLLAKISSFPSPGVSSCFQVQLFDPSTEPMLEIGQQLISQGFAVEQKVSPLQGGENLVWRLLEEVISLSFRSETVSFSGRQEEQRLASDCSIEMMRLDEKPVAESSTAPHHMATSTPVSCSKEEDLEEHISRIKISYNEDSPLLDSPENMQSSSRNARFPTELYVGETCFLSATETSIPAASPQHETSSHKSSSPGFSSVPLENSELQCSLPVAGPCLGLEPVLESNTTRELSVPQESSRLESSVPQESSRLESSVPQESSRLESSVPQESSRLESSVPQESSRLESSVPQESSRLESSVPQESSRLESSVFEDSSQLESSSCETSSSTDSSDSSTGSSPESMVSSEEQSTESSSLDDSSLSSPRGCFYHVTDQMSTSSIFDNTSCDVITISSDSEEEAGRMAGKQQAARDSDVLLSSGSEDDVIFVGDHP